MTRRRHHTVASAALVIAAGLSGLIAALPPEALAAERKGKTAPTIGDLKPREVEIRRDQKVDASADRAIENYRRFLESPDADPEQQTEALRRLGDLNLEAGEGERMDREAASVDAAAAQAIALYQQLLTKYPDGPRNAAVLYQLARAYETTGQVEKALETLDTLTRKYPEHANPDEVAFRRGEILFSAKRYAEAEKAYRAALDAGAKGGFYSQSLYKHGWSLFKQGLNEDSLPSFVDVLNANLVDREGRLRPMESLSRADRELVDDTLRVMGITFSYLEGAKSLDEFIAKRGTPVYSHLLYSRLGDLYVEKQRYQDAADTYRAFVARDPVDENAPLLAVQAIEAYRKGGFGDLVLTGKREFVERYNFEQDFWRGRDRAQYPQVVSELRTNLKDVSTYQHALAQKSKKPEDYQAASRLYRDYLKSFPDDPEAAQTNYLLAETLLEGRNYVDAAAEFDRTAYEYPRSERSAKAAYAALVAYDRERNALQGEAKAAWNLRTIEAGIRFAESFPEHPDSGGVLTRAAQDVFALGEPKRSIEVAQKVLAHQPPVDGAKQRIAWTIVGQSNFDLGQFEQAETAYAKARDLAPANDPLRADLSKRLAASVYRQAETRRESGDGAGAVDAFLRVASLSPDPVVRATAEYDAAAQLINLKQWERAAGVLEGYRRKYPNDARAADVTRSLAVAYSESGRAAEAAVEFERIALTSGEDAAVRREALLSAAELYEKAGNLPKAGAVLERFVADNPRPVARAIDARQKLVEFAAQRRDREREAYWQKEIVAADARAGEERTERTKLLAARASLALAAPAREQFRAIRLVAPLKRSLDAKRKALDAALTGYRAATEYKVAEVTTAATFEMAELYRRLGQDLLKSERPKRLSAEEREQYDLLLEEQAFPFEEQAIQMHEVNAQRVREGIYDDSVRRSYAELAALKPGRYGKTELAFDRLAGSGETIDTANVGLVARSAGDLAGAEATLASAAARSDAPATVLNELGITRRRMGKLEEAMAAYARALELDPAHGPANRNMAVLLDIYLGDPARALPYMERYAPTAAEARQHAGWLADLRQRSGKRTDGAPAGSDEAANAAAGGAGSEQATPNGAAPASTGPSSPGSAAPPGPTAAPAPAGPKERTP